MSSTGDFHLLEAMQGGSLPAFDVLYDRHAASVYSFALKQVNDEDVARTITQDVFLSAWVKRRKLTLHDGSVRPWLLRASQFEVWRAMDRGGRQPIAEPLTESDPMIPEVEAVEDDYISRLAVHSRVARITAVVAGLLPLDQQVFVGALKNGEPAKVTATRLGISVDSVRKRLVRIRKRLRAELENFND